MGRKERDNKLDGAHRAGQGTSSIGGELAGRRRRQWRGGTSVCTRQECYPTRWHQMVEKIIVICVVRASEPGQILQRAQQSAEATDPCSAGGSSRSRLGWLAPVLVHNAGILSVSLSCVQAVLQSRSHVIRAAADRQQKKQDEAAVPAGHRYVYKQAQAAGAERLRRRSRNQFSNMGHLSQQRCVCWPPHAVACTEPACHPPPPARP